MERHPLGTRDQFIQCIDSSESEVDPEAMVGNIGRHGLQSCTTLCNSLPCVILGLPSYQGYTVFPTWRNWHGLVPSSDERRCKQSAAKKQQLLSGTHDEVDRLSRDHLGVFTGVVHRTTATMVEYTSILTISQVSVQRDCLQKVVAKSIWISVLEVDICV
jgi:hypothetical protein